LSLTVVEKVKKKCFSVCIHVVTILFVLAGDDESLDFNITYGDSCTCDSTSNNYCNVTISPNETNCDLPTFSLVLNHNYTNNDHLVSNSHSKVCMLIRILCNIVLHVPHLQGCQNVCVSNSSTLLAELTDCGGSKGALCWILIGFGCVISLLLIIILTLCVVIVYLLAKGKRYQYTPNVVLTQNSTDQNQIQEEQPPSQNQGKYRLARPDKLGRYSLYLYKKYPLL
jgi:hypothetical protein